MSDAAHAAGYPGMKDYGMIRDVFADTTERWLNANTFLPRITESGYLGKIKNKGDTITIAKTPKITGGAYARGQKLDIKTDVEDPLTLEVKRAYYWTQFYDQLDLHQTHLEHLTRRETVWSAAAATAEYIEREFLAAAPSMAHPSNTGNTAGLISKAYNMGSAESPVALSRKNAVAYITQIFSMMSEQNVPDSLGEKSVLIPEFLRWYLLSSEELQDAGKIGGPSTLKTNFVKNIGGVNVYSSQLLTPVNSDDKWVFPVFACCKSAINFVVALNDVKVTEPYDMRGTLLSGLSLYDWGNVRSEGVAYGYVYAADTTILSATGS